MLLTLCTFLQSIHQPTNARNGIQFKTSIKLLNVSARGCHPLDIFQIKGIQAQHTDVGISSPTQKWLKYYLLNYLLTYFVTTCWRVLLEKLTVSQIIKKFPAFYGIRNFITAHEKCMFKIVTLYNTQSWQAQNYSVVILNLWQWDASSTSP